MQIFEEGISFTETWFHEDSTSINTEGHSHEGRLKEVVMCHCIAIQFKVIRRGRTRDHELLFVFARLFKFPQVIRQIPFIPVNISGSNNMEAFEIVMKATMLFTPDKN